MAIIIKRRTIRPSTRRPTSPYRIHTDNVGPDDILRILIDHEDNPGQILFEYEISGRELEGHNSIHFKAKETSTGWQIHFINANPRWIR